jgi:hypothetical protein
MWPVRQSNGRPSPLERRSEEEAVLTLKDVFQQFLDGENWEDEITQADGDNTHFINTGFVIDGQNYRLILITSELLQTLRVVLISPLKIPNVRARETAIVLNALNVHIAYGNFELREDGTVYYRWGIDVEGAKAVPKQFAHLINGATSAFSELRAAVVGAAAFSKQPAEVIISDYKKAVARPVEEPLEAVLH